MHEAKKPKTEAALVNALRATYIQAESLRISSRVSQVRCQLHDEGIPAPPLGSFCVLPWDSPKSRMIDWEAYRHNLAEYRPNPRRLPQ